MISDLFFERSSNRRSEIIRRRAFTLVELLVTASLMALVAGATVSALAGGLRVWERSVQFGTHHEAALIAFSEMKRELMNARRFALLKFEGKTDQCAFAAAKPVGAEEGDPAVLGRLGFFLDRREHLLCRSFVPYPRVKSQRLTDHCQIVLEGVRRVRFRFFGRDDASGAVGWHDRWEAADPPMAVQADVTVGADGDEESTHSFVVVLPGTRPEPEPSDAS